MTGRPLIRISTLSAFVVAVMAGGGASATEGQAIDVAVGPGIDPRAQIEALTLEETGPLSAQAEPGVAVEELPSLPPEIADEAESISRWDTAVFRGLDKVTARVNEFNAPVGGQASFGSFDIVVRQCNKRPPEDTPYTTALVEVVENTLEGERKGLFAGWMFAASPGLNAVEHPVYDVWLIDCKMASGDASADSR